MGSGIQQLDANTLKSAATTRRERASLCLVSSAHFLSHFYFLVLPPLFLAIQAELDISFTQLGFMMTMYALGSASGQYPMGILIDKYGPRYFLIAGMALVSACFIAIGYSSSYWQLVGLALLAGLGDSVFHPANFAIITAQFNERRLGRAYAIHAFMGFAGFAAAPIIVDPLRANWDWHVATTAVGLVGLGMVCALFVGRQYLISEDSQVAPTTNLRRLEPVGAISFLRTGPILMLFVFYIVVALAGTGITQFSTSALPVLYDVEVSEASKALFVYMLGVSIGVLVGGIVSDRFGRLDAMACIGYGVASTLMVIVSFTWFPFLFVVGAFFVGGFMIGIVFPSRDLMVRAVSPKGSSGKAFGFVNSGFGYGGMIGPLIYGAIMDTGFIEGIYITSVLFMSLAIAAAIAAGVLARSRTAVQPAA